MSEGPRRGDLLLEAAILGQPKGAGSKVAEPLGKRGHEARDSDGRIVLKYRHATKGTAEWMETVSADTARRWRPRMPADGALILDVAFYELRPKSHFKADGTLRPDAPAFPHQTVTHDIDKLRRAISDSLKQGFVIKDDKRVIAGAEWKMYADEEPYEACAMIRLFRCAQQTVADLAIVSPPPEGQETIAL